MAKKIIIAIVVVAALAGAGWWAWTTWGEGSTEETALGGSGIVEADEVAVSAVISGRILTATGDEGSDVTSGTVLFTLDAALLDLQVEQAQAGVKAAEAALAKVKADQGSQAEIDQATARVTQANAALEAAKVQQSYATVTVPSDGVLTQVTASVGENASPGKTLATVADLDNLHVSIYIPETQIGQVKLGDKATIVTDSSTMTFEGEVVFIASEAEFTPSNIETKDQRVKLVYEVRLDVTNAEDVLKPGMPVDVTF